MQNDTLDLNGLWQYKVDVDENRVFENTDSWQEMAVPSNWHLTGLEDYSGTVWFKREFDVPEDWGERQTWLRFHGVDYYADVWLNGRYLGYHEGYFQPFEFNVTSALLLQGNVLLVRVNSPFEKPDQVWPDKKRLIKGIFGHHDCRPGSWHAQ
ncbi:MAG: hypothetical protein SVX38_14665, partial [Chloroflexota bacterium]|nr:hypothetical protein [Chloroflexota bacterium]